MGEESAKRGKNLNYKKLKGDSIMDERDVYRAKEATKEAMQSAMKKGPMRLALIIGAILIVFLFLQSMGSDWGR